MAATVNKKYETFTLCCNETYDCFVMVLNWKKNTSNIYHWTLLEDTLACKSAKPNTLKINNILFFFCGKSEQEPQWRYVNQHYSKYCKLCVCLLLSHITYSWLCFKSLVNLHTQQEDFQRNIHVYLSQFPCFNRSCSHFYRSSKMDGVDRSWHWI